jgi:hypothetical protein
MNLSNRHIEQCVSYAIQYYHKYSQQCDNLAKRANELIERVDLKDFFCSDISCEYQTGNGLVFVFELNDNDLPHNISCSSFFDLFNENSDEITIQDLKMLSL